MLLHFIVGLSLIMMGYGWGQYEARRDYESLLDTIFNFMEKEKASGSDKRNA